METVGSAKIAKKDIEIIKIQCLIIFPNFVGLPFFFLTFGIVESAAESRQLLMFEFVSPVSVGWLLFFISFATAH